jgi:hypothetical protein
MATIRDGHLHHPRQKTSVRVSSSEERSSPLLGRWCCGVEELFWRRESAGGGWGVLKARRRSTVHWVRGKEERACGGRLLGDLGGEVRG